MILNLKCFLYSISIVFTGVAFPMNQKLTLAERKALVRSEMLARRTIENYISNFESADCAHSSIAYVPNIIAFNPVNKSHVATVENKSTKDACIILWNTEYNDSDNLTFKLTSSWNAQDNQSGIQTLTFDPHNQDRLLSSNSDGAVHVWDTKTGSCMQSFTFKATVNALAFSLGNNEVLCGLQNGIVAVGDLVHTQIVPTHELGHPVTALACSQKDRYLIAVALADKTIRIFNKQTFSNSLNSKTKVLELAFNSKDNLIGLCEGENDQSNIIALWDIVLPHSDAWYTYETEFDQFMLDPATTRLHRVSLFSLGSDKWMVEQSIDDLSRLCEVWNRLNGKLNVEKITLLKKFAHNPGTISDTEKQKLHRWGFLISNDVVKKDSKKQKQDNHTNYCCAL